MEPAAARSDTARAKIVRAYHGESAANEPAPDLINEEIGIDIRRLRGKPDDLVSARACDHYLKQFNDFSDIYEERPRRLSKLELEMHR